MHRERRDPLLGPSLAISLGLHALVILPLLAATLRADEPRGVGALVEPPPEDPPLPADEPEAPLGIDRSDAVTLNWIGYEEYAEHLAKLAETDQAAFIDDDAGGGGGTAGESTRPQGETADSGDAPRPPANERSSPASGGASPPGPPSVTPATAKAAEVDSPQKAVPGADPMPAGDPNRPDPAPPSPTPAETDTPAEQPTPSPQESPQRETPPTPPSPPPAAPKEGDPAPAAPGPPRDAPPKAGDAAEKESDAFSAIDVPPELWKLGKPLAMKGLEIRTRRPTLPLLTQLTTRPRDPVVELRFHRNGRVVQAQLLSSTGFPQVDGPILDALYAWTAKGEVLSSLDEDQVAIYRIRMILRD